jgi:long-chain acyl-CoA synthetase
MENIPSPPFIITPNHTSYLDGFVLFASLPFRLSKNLYFQGLRKYFPYKTISELINVIPVSTESDLINAMERSREILRKGLPLCIFPEGGRSFDGELRELKIGFAILSIETGVPVIPVFIDGTFKILPRGRFIPRRGRIRVYIDKPLLPSHGLEKAEDLSDELKNRMLSLKERLSLP